MALLDRTIPLMVVHSKRLISQYLPSPIYTLLNINCGILLIRFYSLLFCINIWKQNVSLHLLVIMMMKLCDTIPEANPMYQNAIPFSYRMSIPIFYCA